MTSSGLNWTEEEIFTILILIGGTVISQCDDRHFNSVELIVCVIDGFFCWCLSVNESDYLNVFVIMLSFGLSVGKVSLFFRLFPNQPIIQLMEKIISSIDPE